MKVAAILDTYGGVRTVVGYVRELRHHVRHDEICVVVPKFTVRGPIPWNDIPRIIALASRALIDWCDSHRPNEAWQREAITMFRLRLLEQTPRSLHLPDIVET